MSPVIVAKLLIHCNFAIDCCHFRWSPDEMEDCIETPSISYGVLHEGNVILRESRGLRDVDRNLAANTETTYMLSSCSKMFLVAAIAICVDEGTMSWDDQICKHVPDFNPQGDPKIRANATIRNALSHTTGLGKQQPLLFGPHSTVITTTRESFLNLVNNAHTRDGEDAQQRFGRQVYLYNNLACGLATLALERASGEKYADFLQGRILRPLKMTQTIVTKHRLATETNLAYGYAKMESDDKFVRIDTEDYTDEGQLPLLSVVGIHSSVTDLLKWATSLLEAYDEPESGSDRGNPLRQVQMFWEPQVNLEHETSYCMGFYRGTLPTPSFGAIGLNNKLRGADADLFEKYIIGRQSEQRQFIGHSGNWNGYAAAIYLFPETKSAVVALTNAMDLGDAADFTAKTLTQALFNMEPKVDLLEFAEKESELFVAWFKEMQDDWLRGRNIEGVIQSDLADYVGTYTALQTSIDIFVDEEMDCLAFTMNGIAKSQCNLEFYDEDSYSFLPRTRDEWLLNAMLDWDYYGVGLFYFQRDHFGKIDRFCWMYEITEPSAWFHKPVGEPRSIFEDFSRISDPVEDSEKLSSPASEKSLQTRVKDWIKWIYYR